MAMTEPSRTPVKLRRRFSGPVAVLTVAAILGGCSQVPDYLNPVEWYRGTKDWIMGDDAEQAARPQQPLPGADKPFPSLSTVPERPATASTPAERARAARSLDADRRGARYSDQVIRRQADTRTALPRKPTPPVTSAVPAQPVPRYAPPPMAPSAPAAPAPGSPFGLPPAPPALAASAPGSPFGLPPAPPAAAVAKAPERLAYAPIPGTESYLGEQRAAPARRAAAPAAGPFAASLPESAGAGIPASAVAGLPGSAKVATVYFATGSSRVSRDGEQKIRQAYQAYRSQGGLLRVVGHASSRTRNLDPMRHRIANFRISVDRANRVARALIRLGAKPDAVFIEAMSDTDRVFFEMMPAGEAENRRVEIFLER